MILKKIVAFSNDLSVTTKISLGFALVFSIFISLSLVFYHNLKIDKESLQRVAQLSTNTAKILNINREISEIQRLTNVYSMTGGHSVIEKIKDTHKNLKEVLEEVQNSTHSVSQKELVDSLIKILTSYGQNIDSLEERYTYRNNLLKEAMPDLQNRGTALFEQNIFKFKKSKNYKNASIYQSMLRNWYKANDNALHFIEEKKYTYRSEVEKNLSLIKSHLKGSLNSSNNQAINQLILEFDETFDQTIQANRIYLSLVNVVMAGAAIEFTAISQGLKEDSLKELQNLLKENKENFYINKKAMHIFFLITLPLLILIGFYYQVSVANSMKGLAKTFESFINGDLDQAIPGLERKDEVGQLANAANAFKEVSKRIKEEQTRAEQLTESKSRFLATMSHEIRTPMNAVLSCTHLLMDDVSNTEHIKLLETIQTSGDALLVLINDILDFSKIESGKLIFENETLDLHETLASVIELLNSNASRKGVILELKIDDSLPRWVQGDVTRLRQVLVNLVGNGIKFTKSRVQVTASATPLDASKDQLLFSVKDDGIGMDQEAQDRLFKEFSQVDASTTRKFGGTGLGLAICKGIVEAMGGKIWVESKVSKGSNFLFTLESIKVVGQAPKKKKMKLSEINPDMAKQFHLKILMAEDNSVNQMVAKKLLSKLGYRIDTVANGLEAIAAVKNKNFDVIFMDQHMPEMDGVEATIEIRKMAIPQPRIYALTASAFKEDKDRCLNAGMDGFLTKPIMIEDLVSALRGGHLDPAPLTEKSFEQGPIFNRDLFDEVLKDFSGDEELLKEIIVSILKFLPGQMDDVKAAALSQDGPSLEKAAHSLKGMLANLRVSSLCDTAFTLEKMGRDGSFRQVEAKFHELKTQVTNLTLELEEVVQKKSA